MRTVRVMFKRTFARLSGSFAVSVSVIGFLALSAGLFVRNLSQGEGGTLPVAALWALSAAPCLPALAALVTMRVWSDERSSGRLELLLTVPALERDLVFGTFLGSFAVLVGALLVYLTVPLIILPFCAPALSLTSGPAELIPAIGILLIQGLFWCAFGLFASACFRSAAVAAFVSLILMVAVPHGVFQAALAWSPALRARIGAIPFETHVLDAATGLFSSAGLLFYAVLTCCLLFAATKAIAFARFSGRGGAKLRLSTGLVVALAFVFSCLLIACAIRLDLSFEIPRTTRAESFSARTRSILSDMHGDVRVTCFLPRRAPEFRVVSRLLDGLGSAAAASAGARLTIEFVDPRWDLATATRLVRSGAPEGSLIFARGRRRAVIPVSSLFATSVTTNSATARSVSGTFVGESACASALLRLSLPAARGTVYATAGHGEPSFDSYDATYGLSLIARDLRRDGYRLKTIDLASAPTVPGDCAVLIVPGARDPFSRAELTRLDGYLRNGGRLLVLTSAAPNAGPGSLLASWGVRILPFTAVSPWTRTGADTVATDFADHAITRPLAGGSVLFSAAAVLAPSGAAQAADDGEKTADRTGFTALVRSDPAAWGESDLSVRPWIHDAPNEPIGPLTLAVALERGGSVSKDLALRPTRIVVIGDATFVLNGALSVRANANRDLFLNAVAWLSGLDASTASSAPGDILLTRMGRTEWIRFAVLSVTAPACVVLLFSLAGFLRRRRES